MSDRLDDPEQAWNNDDWDDHEETLAIAETDAILHPTPLDDVIRTNLDAKIQTSKHAYKIAGIALIVCLVAFTINTVLV